MVFMVQVLYCGHFLVSKAVFIYFRIMHVVLDFLHSKLSSPELLNEKCTHSLQTYDQFCFFFFYKDPCITPNNILLKSLKCYFSKKIHVCVYTHTHTHTQLGL